MREPHVTPSVVEPIVGLAQRYAMLTDEERPDAARLLYEHALAEDLPMPAGRGVPEAFAWIAQRLSRRRLLEDLGVTRREVEWLTLHVPPGGTGSPAYPLETEAHPRGPLKVGGSGFR